ncbi:MAG: hypothetical protein ACRD0D_04145, partial [Acidimicrobiales bacterium]
LIGSLAAPEQMRTMIRDISSRQFTLNVNQTAGRRSEDRADSRMRTLQRTLLLLGAATWWRDHRRRSR